jgi:uncharacterized membrane protein
MPTMIQKIKNLILDHRYEAAIFGLMALSSATCVTLVAARMEYTDTRRHLGLVWNLFLAWIPFVLAYFAYALSWRKRLLYFVLPFTVLLWLLFFPNAPYILTDLQHLFTTSGAPLWYDVILMIWFSWTGLLLGLVSLYLMHDIIHRNFGRWWGWVFVLIVSVLSSFGVYLGRFIRFNSWDVFNDPTEVAVTILGLAIDPSKRLIAFTVLFAVFYMFVYLTLYSFAHLVQERNGQVPSR